MENMRVMAENLAAQHDPVAEYLLEDISTRLSIRMKPWPIICSIGHVPQ